MTRLVQLGLSKNNLTWVSGEIGALTGLHTLDLCCNKLTDLPSEFGGLMRGVSVGGCFLFALP